MVADASANLFKAMHNLRTDRASTIRSSERRSVGAAGYRKISSRSSRCRDAGDAAPPPGCSPPSNSPIKRRWFRNSPADPDDDGPQKPSYGMRCQAQGFAPPRDRQGIHWITARCLRPSTRCQPTRRGRQPQRRGDRSIADDQADRLAVAQYGRRTSLMISTGLGRRPRHARTAHQTYTNSSAASRPRGTRWRSWRPDASCRRTH